MSLSHEQVYWSSRAASEPPSPIGPTRPPYYRMRTDPTGRYKGNNYDPNYRRQSTGSQGRKPPGQGSGYSYAYGSQGDDRSYAQYGGQNQQNGYSSHSQGSPYVRDNGYNKASYSAPIPPDTVSRNTPLPSGPATSYTAPLHTRPVISYDSSPSVSERPLPSGPSRPALNQEPVNPPRTAILNMPDWGKEDGEMSSSGGPSTPSSAKVHPSRLGQIPSNLSNHKGHALPSTDRRAETPVPVESQRRSANQRNSKPDPLTFTPINAAPSASNSTPSQKTGPSDVPSSVTKSPLDSLEKLRQFKEQVAASRKSVSSMSGPEMTKLAQVAETFLKSQNPDASADALEQLKRQMGTNSDGNVVIHAAQGRPSSSLSFGPGDAPDRPTSRQAELKERLLALKSGRDPNSQSPRDSSTMAGNVNGTSPHRAQVNGNAIGQKRDRDPADAEYVREDDDQKRFRAEAWQKAQDREREVRNAIDSFRESTKRDTPAPTQARIPQGRMSGPPTASSIPASSPSRPPEMNGDDRQTPLANRISTRPQPRTGGPPPWDQRSTTHDRPQEKTRYDYRSRRDGHVQDRSRSSPPGPRRPINQGSRGYDRGPPANTHLDYRSDGSERSLPQERAGDRVLDRRVKPAPRTSHPPAPRRSIESEYARPRYDPVDRHPRERETASYHSSPVKSEQPLRPYDDRPRAAPEAVRYARPSVHPQPMPILVPALPAVDPATVHATLDILKAQIARLEQLVPAIPSPAASAPAYEYAYPPVAAVPPHQQARHRETEYDDRGRDQPYAYEPRRAASPPPPPPPPPRGYEYEPRRAPRSPPTYHSREAAPRKEPYERYQHSPKQDKFHRHGETNNHHKRTQGYDNRSSGRGGRGGYHSNSNNHNHHYSRGGSTSGRGGDRGGRGGRGGYRS